MYFANSPATLPTTRRNAKDRNARATEDGVRTIRFVDIFVGHFSVAGGPRERGPLNSSRYGFRGQNQGPDLGPPASEG